MTILKIASLSSDEINIIKIFIDKLKKEDEIKRIWLRKQNWKEQLEANSGGDFKSGSKNNGKRPISKNFQSCSKTTSTSTIEIKHIWSTFYFTIQVNGLLKKK
jgi:hypothetical protein